MLLLSNLWTHFCSQEWDKWMRSVLWVDSCLVRESFDLTSGLVY